MPTHKHCAFLSRSCMGIHILGCKWAPVNTLLKPCLMGKCSSPAKLSVDQAWFVSWRSSSATERKVTVVCIIRACFDNLCGTNTSIRNVGNICLRYHIILPDPCIVRSCVSCHPFKSRGHLTNAIHESSLSYHREIHVQPKNKTIVIVDFSPTRNFHYLCNQY